MPQNWVNRTLFTGDNLDVMRGMNSESADLIYLDPPFNSNRDYAAPIGSAAAGAAFKDTWTLSDVDEAWHGLIAEEEPALYRAIDAAGVTHGKSMKSYLVMMAVRLLEMRRLLKPIGSVYLHCDPTASHYLKMLMDAILGAENFRNEVIWKRTGSHGGAKRWGPIHDVILFYTASNKYKWAKTFQDYSPEYLSNYYRYEDDRGKYQLVSLTGEGTRQGDSGNEWRGVNPTDSGRHWAVPKKALQSAYSDRNDLSELTTQEKLDLLDSAGLIYWPSNGGVPRQKRYVDEGEGVPIQDMVTDIAPISSHAKERIGYPTQKPLALLERIVKASSRASDVVLDPFCGCATALVAAEKLERQWVGIDLSEMAYRLVLQRLARDVQAGSEAAPRLTGWNVTHRTDIPRRTDLGKLPNYKTHRHTLFGRQEGVCAGCEITFPFRNMTVDHIVPQSKGGTDHLDNLQLLCAACNSLKGAKSQAEFMVELRTRNIRG